MTSKFKALGLAMMAVLAMSAIGAAGAQAASPGLEAEGGNAATITGNEINQSPDHPEHTFTSGSSTLRCSSELFDGTLNAGLNTSVTVTPTYSGCEATRQFLGHFTFPVTVTHNGCNYTFHGGQQTEGNANHFDNVTVDIVCPPGKTIEVHIYSNASNHNSGTSGCTITIHGQENLHVNTIENTTTQNPHDVDITTQVDVVTTVHPGTLGGLCGNEKQVSRYTGATTVRAYSDEAHQNQIDLTAVTGP